MPDSKKRLITDEEVRVLVKNIITTEFTASIGHPKEMSLQKFVTDTINNLIKSQDMTQTYYSSLYTKDVIYNIEEWKTYLKSNANSGTIAFIAIWDKANKIYREKTFTDLEHSHLSDGKPYWIQLDNDNKITYEIVSKHDEFYNIDEVQHTSRIIVSNNSIIINLNVFLEKNIALNSKLDLKLEIQKENTEDIIHIIYINNINFDLSKIYELITISDLNITGSNYIKNSDTGLGSSTTTGPEIPEIAGDTESHYHGIDKHNHTIPRLSIFDTRKFDIKDTKYIFEEITNEAPISFVSTEYKTQRLIGKVIGNEDLILSLIPLVI